VAASAKAASAARPRCNPAWASFRAGRPPDGDEMPPGTPTVAGIAPRGRTGRVGAGPRPPGRAAAAGTSSGRRDEQLGSSADRSSGGPPGRGATGLFIWPRQCSLLAANMAARPAFQDRAEIRASMRTGRRQRVTGGGPGSAVRVCGPDRPPRRQCWSGPSRHAAARPARHLPRAAAPRGQGWPSRGCGPERLARSRRR
jgi:hypothetical protein